jgi:hypothetical protein
VKANTKIRQITLGDLIVGITDAARRFAIDEREAYRVTGLIVNRILCPVPAVVHPRPIRLRRRVVVR